ncbi:MAG TPA: copper chaperone PCu(A)C [Woeseiaceae bacterium]|jgi:hypothetical protein|nr:copper chaperone PCu(A)C [Woeseiaceae bacterium]|tara:strand:- start:12925 stop:13353 length:429 start_codon:yes stop_codon:yes gene_type:complete
MKKISLLFLLIILLACDAKESKGIIFNNLLIYAPFPGNTVTAGYTNIINQSDKNITITSITSPQFNNVEIHETVIKDGIAKMIEIKQLMIPKNDSIMLERGGKHLMLFEPRLPIKENQNIKLEILLSTNDKITFSVSATSRF